MDIDYIKSLFRYENGKLIWNSKERVLLYGRQAGCVKKYGYRRVLINNKSFMAHRLCWLICNGKWPEKYLDHINGNRDDNRIENLREVTHLENNRNTHKHRCGKKLGTSYNKQINRWVAYVYLGKRKQKYLGAYDTEAEAHEAYKQTTILN